LVLLPSVPLSLMWTFKPGHGRAVALKKQKARRLRQDKRLRQAEKEKKLEREKPVRKKKIGKAVKPP
jgi:hypothetical protein